MTEYVTRVKSINDLKDGQEVQLFVQDMLWLRSALGRAYDKPWGIKITQKLGLAIPGRPYAK